MDTLVVEPYWTVFPEFFGVTLEELMGQQDPTAWVDFELGKIDEAGLWERFFRDGRRFDERELTERVRAAYRFVDGMEDVLGELAGAGYELHALSNYPDWYRWIEERLELSRFLQWSFVSCHLGVRKPHPDAYRLPVERLGVAPEQCLFIDDRAENCNAAEAEGVPSILFQSAGDLRVRLAERGLL